MSYEFFSCFLDRFQTLFFIMKTIVDTISVTTQVINAVALIRPMESTDRQLIKIFKTWSDAG